MYNCFENCKNSDKLTRLLTTESIGKCYHMSFMEEREKLSPINDISDKLITITTLHYIIHEFILLPQLLWQISYM